MAGMGIEESQRMIAFLSTLKRKQTIILVEHDMDAVFRLADRISVLVYGRVIATDVPEKIKLNEEVRKAYLGEES
jgi:branched-chain amino acid transport system ATP-binding protein